MMVNNELNHIKGRQHGLNKNSAIGINFEQVRNATEILN